MATNRGYAFEHVTQRVAQNLSGSVLATFTHGYLPLINLVQHLAHIHLPRTSTPLSGSVELPQLVHDLSLCALDCASNIVSGDEFIEGSRGGLEFIEYLWVGCCDPVQELNELLVDTIDFAYFHFEGDDFLLHHREVGVGHCYGFVKSTRYERFAAAV